MRILYVSDHRPDGYLLKALAEAGHLVETADEPADAAEMAAASEYQAIVLDWSAPPTALAGELAGASDALVLAIMPRADQRTRTAMLRAGADACFVRPLAFIELEARLEALARMLHRTRSGQEAAEMVEADQAVRLGGAVIALSRREFRVMAYLVDHAGEVVGAERLLEQAWGFEEEPRLDLVRACVSRLRRKLEAAGGGSALNVVAGHGYVFQPRARRAAAPLAD